VPSAGNPWTDLPYYNVTFQSFPSGPSCTIPWGAEFQVFPTHEDAIDANWNTTDPTYCDFLVQIAASDTNTMNWRVMEKLTQDSSTYDTCYYTGSPYGHCEPSDQHTVIDNVYNIYVDQVGPTPDYIDDALAHHPDGCTCV